MMGPISPSSDGNSHINVFLFAFFTLFSSSTFTTEHCSERTNVLFYHRTFEFGITDILATNSGSENDDSKFTFFCCVYNVQFKPRTPNAP